MAYENKSVIGIPQADGSTEWWELTDAWRLTRTDLPPDTMATDVEVAAAITAHAAISDAHHASLDYTEKLENYAASGFGAWEDKDLSGLGVPANAVCDIGIANAAVAAQGEGGVRANGSSLNRKLILHEAEAGGIVVTTMRVKADANSIIEQYSQNSDVSFSLLGYWS